MQRSKHRACGAVSITRAVQYVKVRTKAPKVLIEGSAMITTTCDENSTRPLVIVVHASVGSGHRSAAQAVSQALEDLCGKHPNLLPNTEIAVLDILDYGYVKFDATKLPM